MNTYDKALDYINHSKVAEKEVAVSLDNIPPSGENANNISVEEAPVKDKKTYTQTKKPQYQVSWGLEARKTENEISKPYNTVLLESESKQLIDKLSKNAVEEILRRQTVAEFNKRKARPKTRLSISDIVECIRRSYYAITNENQELGFAYPYMELVQKTGDNIHEVIQNRIPNSEVEVSFTVRDYFVDIAGRYDLLLNPTTLVEIKSIEAVPTKPKKEHTRQALIYAYILNHYFNHDIKMVQILYIARGKFSSGVFDIVIDDNVIATVKKYLDMYMTDLQTHVEELKCPPPKDHRLVNNSNCGFCPYQKICSRVDKYENLNERGL
jgi:CRISPR/Cas system-associated exonuclease Cas4 (RecB family)